MATFKIPGMKAIIAGEDIQIGLHLFKIDGLPIFQNISYALWHRNLGPTIIVDDEKVIKPFDDLTPQEKMIMLRDYIWQTLVGLAQQGDKLPRDEQAQIDNAAVDHELDYVPEIEIDVSPKL